MKKETIKRIISAPTAKGLCGARRGAMMLVATLLLTMTAQPAWAQNIDISGSSTSNASLLHLGFNNSESVTLYTAGMLDNAGLKPGDKIVSITFKGYCENSDDYSTTLNVWYEKTTDTSQDAPDAGKYNTEGMTQLLTETHTWTAVGSSSNWVDLITINLAEPITYDGTGLRFVVCSEGDTYKSGTHFEVTNISGSGLSYFNRNDSYSAFVNSQTWSNNDKVPAIHFGMKSYTVTFDSNGGTNVASQTVIDGRTATEPTAPTMESGTFLGWTLNGADYDFDSEVTSNITLVAKWSVETFYVDENGTSTNVTATTLTGGETTLAAGTYLVNSNITYDHTLKLGDKMVNIILANGKTMSIGTDASPIDDNGITWDNWSHYPELHIYGQTTDTDVAGSMEVYSTYGITGIDSYTQHSGNFKSAATNGTAIIVKYFTLKGGKLTATSTAHHGIFANNSITIDGGVLNATTGSDKDNYAAINSQYDVTINGGQVTATATNGAWGIQSDYGDVILGYSSATDFIEASSYSASDYNGQGKKVKIKDGLKMQYSSNTYEGELTSEQISYIGGKKLRPVTYTVSFDINYEDGTNPEAQTVLLGEKATAPSVTRTGYTFGGWKNGNVDYDFDAAVTSDLELTATWTANTYTVVFDKNDENATGTMANMNLTYDGDWANLTAFGFTAPEGKAFKNWNTANDGSGTSYDDEQPVRNLTDVPNGTVTLYAQWGKDIKLCTATVPNQTLDGSSYICYKFWDTPTEPGAVVKDGETVLVVGTDYEFGQVYFYGTDNACTDETNKVGDHFTVEIKGIGDYAGTTTADFYIISPSANGTHGSLSWKVADGTLSITGKGAMNAAASTSDYPWKNYCSIINTINIAVGVTSIADNAFGSVPNINSYSNVTKVIIPASVTSIGADAFKGCVSATDVYCYADPTNLTWSDTSNDFKSDGSTVCHVADASAWSEFSNVHVTFVGDLANAVVPYIDAEGSTKFCTNFTVLDNTKTDLDAGWYVVNGTVDYTGQITLNGDVNLILADGCTMNIAPNGSTCIDDENWGGHYSLTVYGQSGQSGTLSSYSSGYDNPTVKLKNYIQHGGNVTINSGGIALRLNNGDLTLTHGTLTITGSSYYQAIELDDGHAVTVSGGTLNATGGYAIKGNLNMTGGTLTANGYDAAISGNATLGWSSAADRIKVSSYSGTVTIADGQAFTNGTDAYYLGTLTNAEKTAIKNVELQPVAGVTLTKDGSGELTATLDPSSEGEVSIPVAVAVDHVNVDRIYVNGKASTVYLPFSISVDKLAGGTFNTFTGVNTDNPAEWIVEYSPVTTGTIAANTPYIFIPDGTNGGKITVNNGEDKVSVCTANPQTTQDEGLKWEFIGTYERIMWTHNTTDPEYSAAREAEIGSIYGFAAEERSGATVGQFVKVTDNVWINPMRAYLKNSGVVTARGMDGEVATTELPESMKVVIVEGNSETTGIHSVDNGQWTMDNSWYTIDGRRIANGQKPTAKGLYIVNGKKVVIK